MNFQFLLAIPLRMSPKPRFMSQRKAKTWFWSYRKQHLELSYQYKSKNVSRCGIRLHETGFRIFENIVISDSHKLSQDKISWKFRKFSNLRWKIWAEKIGLGKKIQNHSEGRGWSTRNRSQNIASPPERKTPQKIGKSVFFVQKKTDSCAATIITPLREGEGYFYLPGN